MRLIQNVEARLAGWPDQAVTVALLAVAGALVALALSGRPVVKVAALAWVVAP